jgi:hypothetical protein
MSSIPLSTPPLIAAVQGAYPIFKSVLGATTPEHLFKEHQFTLSDDRHRLYEFTSSRELAEAVLEVDFPRVPGPTVVHHYSKLNGLRGIVQSGQLLLAPVARFVPDGEEFKTFAEVHGLRGYFDRNEDGRRVYEELSHDLYFLSTTEPGNPDDTMLWNEFADGGRGVRLQLRLTPKPASSFRRMAYRGQHPTALKRINDALQAALGLTYTPWTISSICAFYLPKGFKDEREIRLLVKKHKDGLDLTIPSPSGPVWPIPLAAPGTSTTDPWCEIEVIGIDIGPRCDQQAVEAILVGNEYSAVPLT